MEFPRTNGAPDDDTTQRLARALPVLPMAIGERATGALLHINQAAADLLGARAEDLIGRSVREFYVEEPESGSLLRQIDSGDGAAQGDVKLRRVDGEDLWVHVSAGRISYRGAPAVIAVANDITAHKDRERELAQTRDQLARQTSDLTTNELRIKRRAAEAASHAKSVFLAHMSHELRAPLNAILGFSELIRDRHLGRDSIERYVEYGDYIHQAGEHLLALIDDILDLAKVEAGKLTLQPNRFDLTELLQECARMMRPMAERRGLILQTVASPAIALTADRLRTKQMIINLLSNAIKFTQGGGKVELAAHPTADQMISITVADTGIGMSEDQIKVALEPFGRIESAAVADPTGTGLGLPIVRNLIEAHGGRLHIISRPDRGTIARLVFPATTTG